MRCHMAENLLGTEPPLAIGNSSKEERRPGYSLRENPKKSWKLLGLKENDQENPCLVCDKRFRSMKALFVHRKIHSRKDDGSSDWCKDGKGSGSMKSCQYHTRVIRDRKRLNSSHLKEDRYVGLSKTKSDLLLSVLADDKTMHITRRKRTRRIPYDFDERTEGVLSSVPDGFSDSSESEQDQVRVAAVSLTMMRRGKTDFNSLGLGVKPFKKSLASDFFEAGKGRMTEASECNEIHSGMKRKGVESDFPAGMLCGAGEVEHKKPKAARSGAEQMYEAAMMDCDAMGTVGSDSRKRAELWMEPGLNSYRDKVCAEESQVFEESGEENKYKIRDAKSYKQDGPVNTAQGIEGNRGCTEVESIKDNSEKVNRPLCSISCMRSESLSTP